MHIYAVLHTSFFHVDKKAPMTTDYRPLEYMQNSKTSYNAFSEVTQNSQKFLCLRDTDCDKDHDR